MNLPFYPTLILLAALWGGSFLFMRIAAPQFGPIWLIELRVLIAGLVLLPLVLRRDQWRLLRRHLWPLLQVGCLNAALPFSLLAYASLDLTAGLTSILNATVPIFAALVGTLVFTERLRGVQVLGIFLGFVGVVVLVGMPQADGPPPLLSVAAGLTAALSYVLGANIAKRRLTHLPSTVSVVGSQLTAALALLPLLPFTLPERMPDTLATLSVLALALFSTALAFVLYFQLIRDAGPTRTLTVTYLIPVFAIAWGNLFLNEAITLGVLVGGGLILLGVGLANAVRRGRSRARAEVG